MKQADYPCHWPNSWMQENVSMHKSPTPQTFVHESGKVGGRETGKTEDRRLMERKAAQQKKKHLSEELKTRPT